jgi:hypothetical protein
MGGDSHGISCAELGCPPINLILSGDLDKEGNLPTKMYRQLSDFISRGIKVDILLQFALLKLPAF